MVRIFYSKEVQTARAKSWPIVALESTIITHGMPYPENYKTATKVESIIRANGVVPATIAIIDGKIRVGLEDGELNQLARDGQKCVKISRRDIPTALAAGRSGGTTVSATMLIAHRAGIKIFATGGTGGVHRDLDESLDISTDLTELGRTPVAVFSSGVKSILDIGKTLEFLETQGVTVATYDPEFREGHAEFPAFFSRKSGFKSPNAFSSVEQVARLVKTHLSLNHESGLLIGVPVPRQEEIPREEIEPVILSALKEAKASEIRGKEVTPFLLAKVNQLTKGRSLKANVALICNNAKVASEVAAELARLSEPCHDAVRAVNERKTVVIGASVADHLVRCSENKLTLDGYTHLGTIEILAGGVGRNIGDALSRLGHDPLLITCQGDDFMGEMIRKSSSHMDLTGFIIMKNLPTPSISVLTNGSGEVLVQVGDTRVLESLDIEKVNRFSEIMKTCPILVVELNLPVPTLIHVLSFCCKVGIPVWLEPADFSQVHKFAEIPMELRKCVLFTSPNKIELQKMVGQDLASQFWEKFNASNSAGNSSHTIDKMSEAGEPSLQRIMQKLVAKLGVQNVLVTLGSDGVLLLTRLPLESSLDLGPGLKFFDSKKLDSLQTSHIPAYHVALNETAATSGAGDCLVGGMISGFLRGYSLTDSIHLGLECASVSLRSNRAVPEELNSLAVIEPGKRILSAKL